MVTDFGQRRKVSGAPREPMAPHWIAELISRRYLPLATVARKGENIVCSWNSAPGRAMCSEAAESTMLSNLAVCPDVVLNTTQCRSETPHDSPKIVISRTRTRCLF